KRARTMHGMLSIMAMPLLVTLALDTVGTGRAIGGAERAITDLYGDPMPEAVVARLGARRFRHEYGCDALVFTPDGKTLIGHTPSGVIFWDAASGKERLRLPVSVYYPRLAVSGDGTLLAISGNVYGSDRVEGKEISLWEL